MLSARPAGVAPKAQEWGGATFHPQLSQLILPSVATLDRLPELAIIKGMKHKVDFYLWKGKPVARKWPRPPSAPRSAAVQAQWEDFRLVRQGFSTISAEFHEALNIMAAGTQQTNMDVFHSLEYGRIIKLDPNGPS